MRKRKKKTKKKKKKKKYEVFRNKEIQPQFKTYKNFVSRNKQTKQNTLSQETKKHKVSRNKET